MYLNFQLLRLLHLSSTLSSFTGFTFLGAMGIIPLIHWLLIAPDVFRNELAMKGVAMYLPYAIGLFFFLTNLPERTWPQWSEKSRIVSHTLWFVVVVV